MNAADALKTARAAGVEVILDGDDLALNAASAPPAAVLEQRASSQVSPRGNWRKQSVFTNAPHAIGN